MTREFGEPLWQAGAVRDLAEGVWGQAMGAQEVHGDGRPTLAGQPAAVANAIDQGAEGAGGSRRGDAIGVGETMATGHEFEQGAEIGITGADQGCRVWQGAAQDFLLHLTRHLEKRREG